jgi:hypothetical protein
MRDDVMMDERKERRSTDAVFTVQGLCRVGRVLFLLRSYTDRFATVVIYA